MLGFSAPGSNLEKLAARIAAEFPVAELVLEVPDADQSAFEARLAELRRHIRASKEFRTTAVATPGSGGEFVDQFLHDRLVVLYNDLARTDELEGLACLAMATERAVVFTQAAPFPQFAGGGACVEDRPVAEIMDLSMAAQTKLCHDFGEAQSFAAIHRVLARCMVAQTA